MENRRVRVDDKQSGRCPANARPPPRVVRYARQSSRA